MFQRLALISLAFILIAGGALLLTLALPSANGLRYWALSPEEKLIQSLRADVDLLSHSAAAPKQWKEIREVAMTASDAHFQALMPQLEKIYPIHEDGKYRLTVFMVHWTEAPRYGVMLDYSIIDIQTGNTVHQFGRTLKLGFYY